MASIKLKDIDSGYLSQTNILVQISLAALLIIVIFLIAYFALFRHQLNELNTLKNKEQTLKSVYQQKSAEAASLENKDNKLSAIQASFNELLHQLPTDAEIPNLLLELHQAASTNGLRMDSIIPSAPINDGPIQVLPYAISTTGSYGQISRFIRDVGSLSRIITLDSMTIYADKDTKQLIFSATANTYKIRPSEKIETDSTKAAKSESKPHNVQK